VTGVAYEPISLGYACEVKYQLSRTLFRRKHPDGQELDLRRMLLTNEYGQRNFERHIFDWQITPFAAVLEYLERDFQGVFEREDLFLNADGEVEHRRLHTVHPHDFKPIGGLTEALVDQGYAQARSKFDHLARKFLEHLEQPGPFLYVFREVRIYDEAVRLIELLKRRNRAHDFKILFVGYPGETDQWMTALEGTVFKAWIPLGSDKPADRRWEGPDEGWNPALRDWPLTIHGGDRISRTFDESLAPPAPAKPAAGPWAWLRRAIGRG
jgi:hypothetical protein